MVSVYPQAINFLVAWFSYNGPDAPSGCGAPVGDSVSFGRNTVVRMVISRPYLDDCSGSYGMDASVGVLAGVCALAGGVCTVRRPAF